MKYLALFTCFFIFQQPIIQGKRIGLEVGHAIKEVKLGTESFYRLEVRKGEIASNGGRSEIMAEHSGFSSNYKFKFKVKEFSYEADKHFIIADWHHSTILHKKVLKETGITLYSPLVIHLTGTNIVVANRAGVYDGSIDNLKKNTNVMNIYKTPYELDKWYNVEIDIKWSDTNTGSIMIDINGVRKKINDIRTTYSLDYPNFFKVGIYRNLTYSTTSILNVKDIFIDDIEMKANFNRKPSGIKNNNDSIINSVKKKYK